MSNVPEVMSVDDAAHYLGLSRSKVLDLLHQRELGWMHLDGKPAKRKPLYTSRKFCDEYVERRMQAARGVVR
ncbi:MAG: excisionase family DNA-binding protein [Fimbriimonas sp.]